jgi:hypothetical protein
VTCFQSTNQSPEGEAPQFIRLEVPLHIRPTKTLSKLCLQVKYFFLCMPKCNLKSSVKVADHYSIELSCLFYNFKENKVEKV